MSLDASKVQWDSPASVGQIDPNAVKWDEAQPKPRTVIEDPNPVVNWTLGILEQPGAGLYALGSQAVAGIVGLAKGLAGKAAGLPFGQVFQEEYDNVASNLASRYVSITPAGKEVADKLSEVVGEGIRAYGEIAYKTGNPIPDPFTAAHYLAGSYDGKEVNSPAAGAFAQAAATLASLGVGLRGGKAGAAGRETPKGGLHEEPGVRGSPGGRQEPSGAGKAQADFTVEEFAQKYPETARRIRASQVGNIRMSEGRGVLQAVDDALNVELGLPEGPGKFTLGDKLKLTIQKYGAEIPLEEQMRIANAYVRKFQELDRLDRNSRPALPDARPSADSSASAAGAGKGPAGPRRQRGSVEGDGLEKNLPALRQAGKGSAKASTWYRPQDPNKAAQEVQDAFDASFKAMEQSKKVSGQELQQGWNRVVLGHDYNLRQHLDRSGPYGEAAVQRLTVQHGATVAANTELQKANARIFDDLVPEQRKVLNEIVRARRVVQIDQYKGVGTVRHEGGIDGPKAAAYLDSMRAKLGPDFKALNDRADAVFSEQLRLLELLREEGLVDQGVYDKLKNLDYTRTEYLDYVDPVIHISSKVRDMPQSIRSSGISQLGRGKTSAVEMNAQQLLAEDYSRVYNRVFRNRTLKALHELAASNPDNGVVRLPTKAFIEKSATGDEKAKNTPQGWTTISARIGGKNKLIQMKDEFAQEFISRPEPFNAGIGTLFRWASGSQPLKMTATGYNPGFVFAGLPMDVLHTWIATSDVYSPHLPKFLAQMGADLATVAKDNFTRTGQYEQAMMEGLGSSFLAHESRGLIRPKSAGEAQLPTRWNKVKSALGYVNESFDTWVRLAHRKRLIDQGYESWQASAMARDRLDFYQAGIGTRALDTLIPYTNVAVQAFAKAYRAGKRDPADLGVKLAWLAGTAGSVVLANMIASPETWKAISTDDKVRNFNFTFGDQLYVTDPDGNKRYVYIPLRIDAVAAPVNAGVVGALEFAEYGKVPDKLVNKAVQQISPLVGTDWIPTVSALNTYASNFDSFTGTSIYKGPPVKPEDEVRTFAQGEPTSPLAVGIGQVTGMSPMRLEAAASKLINTNNLYIQAAGAGLKLMFEGMNPREQAEVSYFMVREMKRLGLPVKLTNPLTQHMPGLVEKEQAEGSRRKQQADLLDELAFKERKGQGVTRQNIQAYINSQPPEDRQRLAEHYKYTTVVNQVMERYRAGDDLPPRAWWITTAKAGPRVRAQAFFEKYVSMDSAQRQRMMGVANALHAGGIGYLSPEFQRELKRERELLGDEER